MKTGPSPEFSAVTCNVGEPVTYWKSSTLVILPRSATSAEVGVDTRCSPELSTRSDPNRASSAPPEIAVRNPLTMITAPTMIHPVERRGWLTGGGVSVVVVMACSLVGRMGVVRWVVLDEPGALAD